MLLKVLSVPSGRRISIGSYFNHQHATIEARRHSTKTHKFTLASFSSQNVNDNKI